MNLESLMHLAPLGHAAKVKAAIRPGRPMRSVFWRARPITRAEEQFTLSMDVWCVELHMRQGGEKDIIENLNTHFITYCNFQ